MHKDTNLPLAIEIEINSDCNLSCSYCPNSKSSRIEKGFMDPETFKTLMLQLQKYNYSGRISYHFYNEPTLSPNLQKFIEMTALYLPEAKSVLYTNGTLLAQQTIDKLYSAGLKKFIVTEHHKTNLESVKKISDALSLEEKNNFKFSSYKKLPLTNRGGLVKVGQKIQGPLEKVCFVPRCVMVVSLKGNVVACYEDYKQNHVMGNILEQDILDIWNNEKYVYFRNELKNGNRYKFEVCKTCNNQLIIV